MSAATGCSHGTGCVPWGLYRVTITHGTKFVPWVLYRVTTTHGTKFVPWLTHLLLRCLREPHAPGRAESTLGVLGKKPFGALT